MTLSLSPEEVDMLHGVLESYLSDLRMEIVDTENMNFREKLKVRARFLESLIGRLTVELAGKP